MKKRKDLLSLCVNYWETLIPSLLLYQFSKPVAERFCTTSHQRLLLCTLHMWHFTKLSFDVTPFTSLKVVYMYMLSLPCPTSATDSYTSMKETLRQYKEILWHISHFIDLFDIRGFFLYCFILSLLISISSNFLFPSTFHVINIIYQSSPHADENSLDGKRWPCSFL